MAKVTSLKKLVGITRRWGRTGEGGFTALAASGGGGGEAAAGVLVAVAGLELELCSGAVYLLNGAAE